MSISNLNRDLINIISEYVVPVEKKYRFIELDGIPTDIPLGNGF